MVNSFHYSLNNGGKLVKFVIEKPCFVSCSTLTFWRNSWSGIQKSFNVASHSLDDSSRYVNRSGSLPSPAHLFEKGIYVTLLKNIKKSNRTATKKSSLTNYIRKEYISSKKNDSTLIKTDLVFSDILEPWETTIGELKSQNISYSIKSDDNLQAQPLSELMFINNDSNLKLESSRSKYRFVDNIKISVLGGRGGNGNWKCFGSGGDGGSVYITRGDCISLSSLAKCHLCEGRPGVSSMNPSTINYKENSSTFYARKDGLNGQSTILYVPAGTIVTDLNSEKVLLHVMDDDFCYEIARGGKGGDISNGFKGQAGEYRELNIELKKIADVGMVGFPNAGKSTLIAALTNAQPEIANYPFTTLSPILGTIIINDTKRIVLADMPGIIEGASENIGMGFQFLRHIERSKNILWVIDINGVQIDMYSPCLSAYETFCTLYKELYKYKEGMLLRKGILVLNKMDGENSEKYFDEFMQQFKDNFDMKELGLVGIHAISALDKRNLKPLFVDLMKLMEMNEELENPIENVVQFPI